jgi:hypothetical protein
MSKFEIWFQRSDYFRKKLPCLSIIVSEKYHDRSSIRITEPHDQSTISEANRNIAMLKSVVSDA